jgi:signal peptidase I
VPEDNYFMMGDNRDNSSDSRYWGFVPKDNIVGKPIMVYFSLDPEVPFTNLFEKIVWNRIGFFIR